jgi:hypothetical protein
VSPACWKHASIAIPAIVTGAPASRIASLNFSVAENGTTSLASYTTWNLGTIPRTRCELARKRALKRQLRLRNKGAIHVLLRTANDPDIGFLGCFVLGTPRRTATNQIAVMHPPRAIFLHLTVAKVQRYNSFFLRINTPMNPRREKRLPVREMVKSDASHSNCIFQLDKHPVEVHHAPLRRNVGLFSGCRRVVSDTYGEAHH